MRNLYTIELYRLDIASNSFIRIDNIRRFSNLRYTNVLNGVGECSFNLNALEPKATKANFIPYTTQIVIRRSGTIVWFGLYHHFESNVKGVAGQITISGYSYMFHLASRYTDKLQFFQNQNQGYIAESLINLVQSRPNGSLLITVAPYNTSVVREQRTYERQEIAEALAAFGRILNGFDFAFQPIETNGKLSGVNFVQYYPRLGNVRNDLLPLRVGKKGNVLQFGSATDGELYNAGTMEGTGSGDVLTSVYDTTSAVLANAQKADALQKAYTRIEVYRKGDAVTQKELDEDLASYMNEYTVPKVRINLELNTKRIPKYGEFSLGDTLNVDIRMSDINPNAGDLLDSKGQARVTEIAVTFNNGRERLIPKVTFIS